MAAMWMEKQKKNPTAFLIKSVPSSEMKVEVQLFQRYTAAVIFMTFKDTQSLHH